MDLLQSECLWEIGAEDVKIKLRVKKPSIVLDYLGHVQQKVQNTKTKKNTHLMTIRGEIKL